MNHEDERDLQEELAVERAAREECAAELTHEQRNHVGQEPERAPRSASIVATWDDIKELFHMLWGQCGSGKYDKEAWKALQGRLERLERATESLGPDGHAQLIGALRRIDEAFR